MINIVTHNPSLFSIDSIRSWVKTLIKKPRGPEVVLDNLIIGLKRINYNFSINKISKNTDKIHVISGVDALKWAIKEKEKGKVKELIAGPNIVITPLDNNSILQDKHIDKVLTVSDEMVNFFVKIAPSLKNRIYVWPAGTECNIQIENKKRKFCLVYKKFCDEILYQNIIKYLKENKIDYKIIEYGKYKYKDYISLLDETNFMIYLQESESQGLALQEAWAHNVPTLVWNQKLDYDWNEQGYVVDQVKGLQINKKSAPFLNSQNGEFFTDFEEFKNKLPEFIKRLSDFKPAEYCKNNLSIERSAEIYVNIIENK